MSDSDLDLVETDRLVEALSRRCGAGIVALTISGRDGPDAHYSVEAWGKMLTIVGLAEATRLKMREGLE